MFAIGEFSKITGLSLKALRIYHDKNILVPKVTDRDSGYRYYDYNNLERAKIVCALRDMMFSLDDIAEILSNCDDDADLTKFLEIRRAEVTAKIRSLRHASDAIGSILKKEEESRILLAESDFKPIEKTLDAVLVASIRMKGRYEQCSESFMKIGRAMGFNLTGKPMNLYFDEGFVEDGADFESCIPVKKIKNVRDITIRELPAGQFITVLHKGPYHLIGRSYAKVFALINDRGLKAQLPSREFYIKGPGMVFKGNPAGYVTELQVPFM